MSARLFFFLQTISRNRRNDSRASWLRQAYDDDCKHRKSYYLLSAVVIMTLHTRGHVFRRATLRGEEPTGRGYGKISVRFNAVNEKPRNTNVYIFSKTLNGFLGKRVFIVLWTRRWLGLYLDDIRRQKTKYVILTDPETRVWRFEIFPTETHATVNAKYE